MCALKQSRVVVDGVEEVRRVATVHVINNDVAVHVPFAWKQFLQIDVMQGEHVTPEVCRKPVERLLVVHKAQHITAP